jgi:hypothetical protein
MIRFPGRFRRAQKVRQEEVFALSVHLLLGAGLFLPNGRQQEGSCAILLLNFSDRMG